MEEEINIFVRSMDERKEKFAIKPSDSISTLREAVHQKFEIQLDEIYLLFRGRKLEDTQTISSCKVNDGDTILLVKKANPPPQQPTQSTQSTQSTSDNRQMSDNEGIQHSIESMTEEGEGELNHSMQILRRYYERARNSLQEPNTDAAHRLDRVYSENILRIMPQLDEIVEGAKQINDILKARVSNPNEDQRLSPNLLNTMICYIFGVSRAFDVLLTLFSCYSFQDYSSQRTNQNTPVSIDNFISHIFESDPELSTVYQQNHESNIIDNLLTILSNRDRVRNFQPSSSTTAASSQADEHARNPGNVEIMMSFSLSPDTDTNFTSTENASNGSAGPGPLMQVILDMLHALNSPSSSSSTTRGSARTGNTSSTASSATHTTSNTASNITHTSNTTRTNNTTQTSNTTSNTTQTSNVTQTNNTTHTNNTTQTNNTTHLSTQTTSQIDDLLENALDELFTPSQQRNKRDASSSSNPESKRPRPQ